MELVRVKKAGAIFKHLPCGFNGSEQFLSSVFQLTLMTTGEKGTIVLIFFMCEDMQG